MLSPLSITGVSLVSLGFTLAHCRHRRGQSNQTPAHPLLQQKLNNSIMSTKVLARFTYMGIYIPDSNDNAFGCGKETRPYANTSV